MLKNASCTPFSESLLLITFMSGLKLLSRSQELPQKNLYKTLQQNYVYV